MQKPLFLVSGVLCAAVGVGTVFWFVSRGSQSEKPIEVTTPLATHDTAPEPAQLAASEKPAQQPPASVERQVVAVPEGGTPASGDALVNPVPNPAPELVVDSAVSSSPPKEGVAASLVPVTGGDGACAAAYKSFGPEARKDRLQLVEAALGEYTRGDPQEPGENARYQAFKDEANWLRAHPKP
jgi:hypothetical protein